MAWDRASKRSLDPQKGQGTYPMLKRISVVMLALLLSVTLRATAHALGIGDAAPKLQVKEFVKGQPVKEFHKGKLYVIEFWATWCGPCKVSIPHLTEMAHKYKDVTFVGVSVWEQSQEQVKPFVTSMGTKMDYTVAMDSVPSGKTGNDGFMAANWMQAAHQDGIPTAFIIDKDAKIAWIGHPMSMDKPLEQIVAGKFDSKAAKLIQEKEAAQQQKMAALGAKFQAAGKDKAKQIAVLDEALKESPELEPTLGALKLNLMLASPENTDKAALYAAHLVETYKDNPAQLNALAWGIVDPKSPKRPEALNKVALKAAMRADELSKGKDAAIADTLARAYFVNDNLPKAIETQARAATAAKGSEIEKELQDRLAEYKKASKRL